MVNNDAYFKRRVDALLRKYGLTPKDYKYYRMAFTHPSAAPSPAESYELLEFFGDAIVLASVIKALIKKHPHQEVGILSRAKSRIVCGENLAQISRKLKLDILLRYDNSILNNDKKISNNIMADVFESLVAAIFLDLGVRKTSKFLTQIFKEIIDVDLTLRCHEDNKSILQELIQKNFKELPYYKLVKTAGPDHDRTFHVQVIFRNIPMGKGKGKTKKIAEQDAAAKTLSKMNFYLDKARNSTS